MNEHLIEDTLSKLKLILDESYKKCKTDSPDEVSFSTINNLAHDCLKNLKRINCKET